VGAPEGANHLSAIATDRLRHALQFADAEHGQVDFRIGGQRRCPGFAKPAPG